ncbi:uncharacterized protein, partial [Bemisia tabaci]|uniref:uncharacterized protein n=1 Tax=Bemisia tabaci TaxID=7038 RepID=UPI003B27F785
MGFLRALWILTYKNVRFRARHWLFTVGEVAVPLLLFYAVVYAKKSYPTVFGQSVRKNETFFPPVSEQTLFQEPFLQGTLHLLYTPPTNFTTELIQLVAVILKTRSYSKVSVSVVGVADESEMESRFFKLYHNKSRELATNPNASLPSGLGIVFQDLPFDGCEPLH